MKKKEPMNLVKSYNLQYTLNGVAWLIYAVLNLLPNRIITKLLCVAVLVVAVITSGIALFAKTEEEDEMAVLHKLRAKAMTLDITVSTFLIICMGASLFGNPVIAIRKLYPFMLGVVQLLTGIIFWKEERASE